MRAPFAALTLFWFLAQQPACRTVSLALPHTLREGETATLVVAVGVIPKGAEIDVTTASGRHLGTISPFGIRDGRASGTYTVPLPPDAISKRRVAVVLSLHWNGKQRAPTKKEVKDVRMEIRRAADGRN